MIRGGPPGLVAKALELLGISRYLSRLFGGQEAASGFNMSVC